MSNSFLGDYTALFTYAGVAVIVIHTLKFLWRLFDNIRTYSFGTGIDIRSLGEWAVVTGGSDGIGKSYAKQLAQRGLNIILLSRTLSKLQDVAKEIEFEYKVKVKVLAVDFTGDLDVYARVREELKGLDIAILVNNVGMAESTFHPVQDLPEKLTRDILVCNTLPVTLMTHMVLPAMVKKNKGAIINVSSGGAMHPCPYITVYSASKAYIDFFTRALQVELLNTNVVVQDLMPYFVATGMLGIRKKYFFLPDSDSYVKSAINTLGQQSFSFGCITHAIQGEFAALIPSSIYSRYVFPNITKVVDYLRS